MADYCGAHEENFTDCCWPCAAEPDHRYRASSRKGAAGSYQFEKAKQTVSEPTPNNQPPAHWECETMVRQYIQGYFKDPYDVRDLEVGKPRAYEDTKKLRWLIPFLRNTKNEFGGYIGRQLCVIAAEKRPTTEPLAFHPAAVALYTSIYQRQEKSN